MLRDSEPQSRSSESEWAPTLQVLGSCVLNTNHTAKTLLKRTPKSATLVPICLISLNADIAKPDMCTFNCNLLS